MKIFRVESSKLMQLIHAETAKEAKREFCKICEWYGLEGDLFGLWKLFIKVKML